MSVSNQTSNLLGFGLAFAVLAALVIWGSQGKPTHEALLERLPLGSGPDQIQPLLYEVSVRGSSVVQRDVRDGRTRSKDLGDYNAANVASSNPSKFSGEIVLFVENGLLDSVVVGFTFANGRLVKKDWGHLPG